MAEKFVLVHGDPLQVDLIVRSFARLEAIGKVKFEIVSPEDSLRYEPTDSKYVAPNNQGIPLTDTKATAVTDTKTPKKATRKKNA